MSYIKSLSKEALQNMHAIIESAADRGVYNEMSVSALLAVIGKESGFNPQFEKGYGGTSVKRIREIFPVTFKKYSDSEIEKIKKDDRMFFNFIYGGRYGNSDTEGYTYRGGGYNQLTFKDNYAKMGQLIKVDLVNHPELINTPTIAAEAAFEYFKRRFTMSKTLVLQRYRASDINNFRNLIIAAQAMYNANAGFSKDTRNSSNDGYKLVMDRVQEIYNYVKSYATGV